MRNLIHLLCIASDFVFSKPLFHILTDFFSQKKKSTKYKKEKKTKDKKMSILDCFIRKVYFWMWFPHIMLSLDFFCIPTLQKDLKRACSLGGVKVGLSLSKNIFLFASMKALQKL